MKYRISLSVLPQHLAAATMGIMWLCGEAKVQTEDHDGIAYNTVSADFDGDPEKFRDLKENWNTGVRKGEPLYGVLGFKDEPIIKEE